MPPPGGGVLPYERLIGCAAVWGLIYPTGLTKMGSIIGHRIDYNGVEAPRGQWHIPSKNLPKYFPRRNCAMPTFCIRNGNGILCFVLFYDIMFCSVIYKYLSFFSWLLYNSICMIKYSLYSEKTFFPYHQYLKPFSISLEC